MRILLYGDPQINWGYPEYMELLDSTFDFLEELLERQTPDLLVHLGDHTDTFGTVDVKSIVHARRRLLRLSHLMANASPLPNSHVILKGNHDLASRDETYATTELMEGENTLCVLNPIRHHGVLFIPYTEDFDGVYKVLAASSPVRGVAAHLDWIGVNLTPQYVSKSGMDLGRYTEIMGATPCFNGHYHNPTDEYAPVYFVGAPLYRDFRDRMDDPPRRGFVLFDTESREVERIVNPHTYLLKVWEGEDVAELERFIASLGDNASKTRVKIFVPTKRVKKARKVASGSDLGWWAVRPTDSKKQQADHTVQVSVTSTPTEVVDRVLSTVGDEFDKDVLGELGRKFLCS